MAGITKRKYISENIKNTKIAYNINIEETSLENSGTITKEEAENMLTSKCFYCGKENAMGIDRIDSSKDYTLDNCVPCCGMCNIMKNKFNIDKWFSKIGEIYRTHVDRCSTTIPKGSTSQANGDGSAELLTAA